MVSQNTSDFDHIGLFREIFERQLAKVQTNRFALHLPRPLSGIRRLAGSHFHFHPELFIQAGGLTDFSFPREKMRLMAGEALLVPRGLPHAETNRNFKSAFLNVVIGFPPEGVSIHAARQDGVHGLEYFKTDKWRQIAQYMDDIVETYHSDEGKKKGVEITQSVKGLFQATLATLLLILRQDTTASRVIEPPKVSECRKFILSHLYDSSLSVKKLAEQLRTSPDYLSHLFASETGERLTDYIHKERIALAKRHLQNPALSIKEVAWACGFADQGYFSRLFRRLSGETPKAFREKFAPAIFTDQRDPRSPRR